MGNAFENPRSSDATDPKKGPTDDLWLIWCIAGTIVLGAMVYAFHDLALHSVIWALLLCCVLALVIGGAVFLRRTGAQLDLKTQVIQLAACFKGCFKLITPLAAVALTECIVRIVRGHLVDAKITGTFTLYFFAPLIIALLLTLVASFVLVTSGRLPRSLLGARAAGAGGVAAAAGAAGVAGAAGEAGPAVNTQDQWQDPQPEGDKQKGLGETILEVLLKRYVPWVQIPAKEPTVKEVPHTASTVEYRSCTCGTPDCGTQLRYLYQEGATILLTCPKCGKTTRVKM
ncbi:MAG: hypothetical protein IJJ14_02685 [Coriobacteriales bacterium]|nr:hypothetical protein [Coriobacteriales bacterium]